MIRVCLVLLLSTATILAGNSDSSDVGQISKQKCKEFAKFGKGVESNSCYFKYEVLLPSRDMEFPHMAYIGEYKENNLFELICGGSIISEQYVLTAAHCFIHRGYVNATHVRFGVKDIDDSKYLQEIKIAQKIVHPEFKLPIRYNDIALLKLEKPIEFNSSVRPACLTTSAEVKSKKAIAPAWEILSFNSDLPKILQKVELEFYNNTFCNSVYKAHRTLPNGVTQNTMVCAGPSLPEKDVCQGGSGDPLQIYHDKAEDGVDCMYDIIGTASFGKACGLNNVPSVFTRVSAYIGWIEGIVWSKT